MASLMENLVGILEQECQEYENLLKLSESKTPVIVSGDLDALARITDEEQDAVSRINHIETDRQKIYKNIANVINKDVNTLKLGELVDMLSQRPEEQKKLAMVHDRLRNSVYAVKRVNDQNKELIESSLEMVEFNLNTLQAMKAAPETANYNKGAHNTGAQMGVARSGFDAKQ